MSALRISLEGLPQLQRRFTGLELLQLPYATMQAINKVAVDVRKSWELEADRVFDRPVPLTRRAVLWKKATRQNLEARIFIRDDVGKGTPPSKYLAPEAKGGVRGDKGLERLLHRAGFLAVGQQAIPGAQAPLDQFGNISRGTVKALLSDMSKQQEGPPKPARKATKGRPVKLRRGKYFVVGSRAQSNLKPGIYQRGSGSKLKTIFIFGHRASYRRIYDIFGMAQREVQRRLPIAFERELAKAVASSKFNKGRG